MRLGYRIIAINSSSALRIPAGTPVTRFNTWPLKSALRVQFSHALQYVARSNPGKIVRDLIECTH